MSAMASPLILGAFHSDGEKGLAGIGALSALRHTWWST
jgi:hypothetical protein